MKKRLVVGIVAHVDAGKTTLAEGLLYQTGQIRKLGRVDHEDAFLDHFSLERKRGITIFSKQARIQYKDMEIVLVDTPGHVDFSPETERTLQVLDVAILVISAGDLVTGHVETLWHLLEKYKVPVFVFVNKMDLYKVPEAGLIKELAQGLGEGVVSLQEDNAMETISLSREEWMEEYLETGGLSSQSLVQAVMRRSWFPCYFGSALLLEGLEELLEGLYQYTKQPEYDLAFAARVYKVSRDKDGSRMTWLKVTGGALEAKQVIQGEKVDKLYRMNGHHRELCQRVEAGDLCVAVGLQSPIAGAGLGEETSNHQMVLEPVLTYRVMVGEGTDLTQALPLLRRLEEEEPMLRLHYEPQTAELHAQVMGEVQMEVLKTLALERYGLEISFDQGSILYKETLKETVVGIGHFEPLRHYAEVHLRLEPLSLGEGLQFDSQVPEDELDRNWQRLILTHLEEKEHLGVLTGAPITDMKITVIAGKAHLKHTEGGDFRQATYRAVRQGLRKGTSVLLEPYFDFRLKVPMDTIGRSMTDITRLSGSFEPPVLDGEMYLLQGSAPVATLREYEKEVASYTGGKGRLVCQPGGYRPCHNAEEVVERIGYQPDEDMANPDSSVFCAHGAGFLVPWYQVDSYAHLETEQAFDWEDEETVKGKELRPAQAGGGEPVRAISLEEIEDIFRTSYGNNAVEKKNFARYHKTAARTLVNGKPVENGNASYSSKGRPKAGPQKQCLIVDGYNILFAWEELKELALINIDSARDKLIDLMSGYQGILGYPLILVFDAYKVKGNPGHEYKYHNIYVVYTKEAQTADAYIEKTVHEMAKEYRIQVATSDRLEQMVIFGEGATRISAGEFYDQVVKAGQRFRADYGIQTT